MLPAIPVPSFYVFQVLYEDAEKSERTRHMVGLSARVDKERLQRWLDEQDQQEGQAQQGSAGHSRNTSESDHPTRLH